MRRQARVQPGSYDEPDAASLLRAAPPAYVPACAAVRPPAKLAPLPAKLAPLPPLPARAPIATPAPPAPRQRRRPPAPRARLARGLRRRGAREFRAQAAQAQATLLAALEAEQAAADDASDYDRHVGDARARLDAMLDEARATRAAAEERVVASSPRLPPPRPELDAHDRRGPALPPLRLPEESKEPPPAGDTGGRPRRPGGRRRRGAGDARGHAQGRGDAGDAQGRAAGVGAAPRAPRRREDAEEYVAEREPFIRAALLLCVVVLVVAAYVAYAAFALWLDCRFRAVAAAWTDDAVSADGLVVERPADTWGQGLLEVVFFCFLFLAILCAIFGACLLANGKLGATFAKSLKETRPGAFERTFGDVSSARGGRLLKAAMVEFGVELLACGLLALLPLRPIERVVTFFEVVQSGLQWGNAFLAVVGVFFAVMAALAGAQRRPARLGVRQPERRRFWLGRERARRGLVRAFGFAAALNEDVAALRVYERLGALCAALWAAMFVVITSRIGSIPRIVDGHCDVRLMSKSWWKRFLGCRKYANDALRHGDGFEDVYVRGAGEIYSVYCDDAARVVYAWEYNRDGEVQRGACGCRVDYYGCLNNDCCQLLKEAARTNAFLVVVFGALVLLLLVAMVLGARYMRDRVRSRRKGRRERVHRTTGGVVFVVFAICAALGLFAAGTLARRGGARSSYYFGRGRLYNNFSPLRVDLKSRLDDTDLLGAGADVCRRRLPEGTSRADVRADRDAAPDRGADRGADDGPAVHRAVDWSSVGVSDDRRAVGETVSGTDAEAVDGGPTISDAFSELYSQCLAVRDTLERAYAFAKCDTVGRAERSAIDGAERNSYDEP
ncbi:hypothetical protein JL722_6438 [Aureococcus anophagefferens]|nr:hypothetical protein JL722_6438 [Aureococcus anophagefferens]